MNAETFLEQFEHLAEAPNGIAKLRELILQLAVRGKLVPQDPNDEHASELIKKIEAERKRHTAEGKIRKTRPLAPIDQDEIPYALPSNWTWFRLGDATTYATADKSEPGSVAAGTWVLELEDIQKITSALLARVRYPDRNFESSKNVFHRGDVLYGKLRPYLDKVLVADEDGVCTTEIIPLRGYAELDSSYLRLAMKTPDFVTYANESTHGMNLPRLGTEKARMALLPIPPLAEQKRIVAKVDELMALCDELEAKQQAKRTKQIALNRASLHALTETNGTSLVAAWNRVRDHFDHLYTYPETVADLRQTVLQLAVMGRLVPQDPSDLPAPRPGKHFVYALECDDGSIYIGQTQDVLKRWEQHATGLGADWTKRHPPVKLVHWEEYDTLEEAVKREKDLKTGFGRKWLKREIAADRTRQAGEPASILLKKIQAEKQRLIAEGVIRKSKALSPIGDEELPLKLQDGWDTGRMADLFRFIDYRGKTPKKTTEGVRLVTAKNVRNGFIRDEPAEFIAESDYDTWMTRGFPRRGDILFTTEAPLGLAAVLEDGTRIALAQRIINLQPYGHLDTRYCMYSIQSPLFQELLLERATGTTAKGIKAAKLKLIPFPVPPFNEQKRIVAKVDQLMTLCDDLESKLQQSQADADSLLTAIVHELVEPQGGVQG